MNNLVNEIYKLSIMKVNSVYPITQGDDTVYLNRSNTGYAIAIPFDDDRIFNETFVGIGLSTNMLNYKDQSFKVLYLFMNDTGDLKKFAHIGSEFIDIENRSSLLSNPYIWVDSWKEMFGDSKKKYLVSDVVAELVAFKHLYSLDKTAKWQGPKDGTHDIVMKDKVVEVKSTTHKTNTYVSINSSYQLSSTKNEELYFVRLEPKPYANSIDSLIKEIVSMGYDENEMEACLKEMGYRKGNRTRKMTYDVLSITSYHVDAENFPILKLDELNNRTKSKNIVSFKLTVDLSNANGITIL